MFPAICAPATAAPWPWSVTTRNTPDPLGGIIRRDGHGNPNGVLEEPPAMNPVAALLPEASEEELAMRQHRQPPC